MVDVRGDVLRPLHGKTPAAVKSNKNQKCDPFKSIENIHKKEGGSINMFPVYIRLYITVFLYPATQNVAGYYIIPSEPFECPSVRASFPVSNE